MDNKISVLYDGHCGLCRRALGTLRALDWRGVIRPVNFRMEEERRQWAPDILLEDLDRAMHIRYANGATLHGFSAFRSLSWHLPLLWILAPLFYLPGVKFVGDRVYARIAARRNRCTHDRC